MGGEAAQRIVLEREANGPYRSLADFVRRVPDLHRGGREPDRGRRVRPLRPGRREALWQLGLFIPSRASANKRAGRATAAGNCPRPSRRAGHVELRPMGAWDQMEADYAVLGLSPRYHPLGLLRTRLPEHYVTTVDLETSAGRA